MPIEPENLSQKKNSSIPAPSTKKRGAVGTGAEILVKKRNKKWPWKVVNQGSFREGFGRVAEGKGVRLAHRNQSCGAPWSGKASAESLRRKRGGLGESITALEQTG